MRTVDAAMTLHVQGEVTTLCHIWEIVRKDTVTFRYTTLDRDLPVLSDGGNIYKANHGGSQSAIQFNITMAVNNLEVAGFFEETEISEEALIGELFNYAKVKFSVVNWADTTMAPIKTVRGWLGEVTRNGIAFQAEIRSLSQALQRNVGSLVSKDCRSEYGDTRVGCDAGCSYPTNPAVFQVGHLYTQNDNKAQVHVSPSVENGYQYRVRNTGTTGGSEPIWNTVIGGLTVSGGVTFITVPAVRHTATVTSVIDRATFLGNGMLGTLPSALGGFGTGGNLRAIPNGHHLWDGGSSPSNVAIVDGGEDYTDVTITALYNDPATGSPVTLQASSVLITNGGIASVSFPATAEGHKPAATAVAFDIVDASVTGANAGFFDSGSITATSGANSGIQIDIKYFTSFGGGGWQATTFAPFPFDIAIGTTLLFKRGCNRKFATCQAYDNVVNFRAEKDIPGSDILFRVNTNI